PAPHHDRVPRSLRSRDAPRQAARGHLRPRRRQGGARGAGLREPHAQGLHQELARVALKPASVLIALTVFAILVVSVGLAVWYMTAMPGKRHHGPLKPLSGGDRQLPASLTAHVVAVPGDAHTAGQPDDSVVSARA